MTSPTTAAAASPFSGFRKRTQSVGPWLRGWLWLLAHLHHILAIAFRRLDPALRESIMIAVSEVNACRWCSYAHQTWGREVGLDESDVAMLADGQVALPNARRAAAVAYARERAEAGFGPLPEPLRARLRSVFDARDADRVEVVARLMHQANMSGNGLDALLARWQGQRPRDSRLVDDLVIGGFAFFAILFAVPLLSLVWRRSPVRVSRELLAFVRSYESVPPGSHALASGGSSRAAHTVAHTATMMRILGWSVLLATPLGAVAYPAGFLWGTHAESPYQPFSPYAFMLVAMYVAWGALMIRGARDPLANRAIVDYGILANALHGLVMLVQAFVYPHEHQHLWADVPFLFVICGVLWRWFPGRVAR